MKPSYIELFESKRLIRVYEKLLSLLESCKLCPRGCKVNRLRGEKGFCSIGKEAVVSSFFAHFGEEKELVGRYGSGTIFFAGCNLKCIYCQNYQISILGEGTPTQAEQLSKMMLYLQDIGCHNINFVTPTHVLPQIIESLLLAIPQGLRIPLVYNCGGYESLEVIRLIEGVFDIYMPDVKYFSPEVSWKYSHVRDYWQVCTQVLKEMYAQVGNLKTDAQGIASRGLIIRHLVLPNLIEESFKILEFISHHISPDCYVNIMPQYRPCFKAFEDELINRRITLQEYSKVIKYALRLGLRRGFPHNL